MKIKSAVFVISNSTVKKCPDTSLPEYAFIGRSNVGKSSLINMLTDRKKLAQTSSTPGKTMLINHFLINDSWHIVDLPGYGFAKRSKAQKEALQKIIFEYIERRSQLTNLFILIDSRHAPQTIDMEFIHRMGELGVPFSIVFTKADKQSNSATRRNVEVFIAKLKEEWEELPPYFITSSLTREGREELLDYIESINNTL